MAIVVTGAGGFVGQHLVRRLASEGRAVVAIDLELEGLPTGVRPVPGDLGDSKVRAKALSQGCTALIHLATVPGGAAEADPPASRRLNLDATYDLLLEAGACGQRPRVIFASSIAVLGSKLPDLVDDGTPINPEMIYGGHKAMIEHAVAMFSNRNLIDGVTLRLPGILARPKGPSGLKSAFMSDLFHALRAKQAFTCPVSANGTIWAQSLARCTDNLLHALMCDTSLLPPGRAVTLPALRVGIGALVEEIARQCNTTAARVTYAPDAALEVAFAAQPLLATPAAEKAGFAADDDLRSLVASALGTLN